MMYVVLAIKDNAGALRETSILARYSSQPVRLSHQCGAAVVHFERSRLPARLHRGLERCRCCGIILLHRPIATSSHHRAKLGRTGTSAVNVNVDAE